MELKFIDLKIYKKDFGRLYLKIAEDRINGRLKNIEELKMEKGFQMMRPIFSGIYSENIRRLLLELITLLFLLPKPLLRRIKEDRNNLIYFIIKFSCIYVIQI